MLFIFSSLLFPSGMESLACSISFWEDALSSFTGNNSGKYVPNKLMPIEDSRFCKELQLLVDAAYSLQDQCQLLFLDQVRLNVS